MNCKYHYEKNHLSKICGESYSYRQCLDKLGIVPAGGNYNILKKYIKKYSIDISHFKLQGWNKGLKIGPKRPINDYLSNTKPIQSWKLKKRLLQEKLFQPQCYNCTQTTWINQPIPLELHHIDGNNLNNNLSNLTLLCPNCHALTDNYRGKNK